MVCRNFILPVACKPCLFLSSLQFAKLILPHLTSGRYCHELQKIITAHYNKHQRNPVSKRRYGRAWKLAGKITPAGEVYHILPLSKGGAHVESNLMALCKQ